MMIDMVLDRINAPLSTDTSYSSGHIIASMSTIPHSIRVEVFAKTAGLLNAVFIDLDVVTTTIPAT